MTDGDALYRAICAAPADDTPRLVYADWLDEHGRAAEAEFIRVGCWLDANTPGHPEYADQLARQEELKLWLKAHAPGPEPTFPAGLRTHGGGGRHWWDATRRGFPRYLEFSGHDGTGLEPIRALAAALGAAFAAVPTRMLVLHSVAVAELAEFLRHPAAGHLDALAVSVRYLGGSGGGAARLGASSPPLGALRELDLWLDPGEAGVLALAAAPHLGRLERLSAGADGLTPAAARAVGAAGWAGHLRSLALTGRLPPEAFEEFCRAGPFPRLHTLDLSGRVGASSFPTGAWREFARSAAFPALARLDLSRSDLSGGRAGALAGAGWLRPADLNLASCGVGDDGAAALAAAPWLGGVRRLDLRENRLTPAGVGAVAASPAVAGLGYLDLSYNTLGPSNLGAVLRNPALRGLRTLLLCADPHHGRSAVTSTHLHWFLSALKLPNLRHLDLSGLPVGARAAHLLTAARFRSLTRLGLRGCGLADKSKAPAFPHLVEFVV